MRVGLMSFLVLSGCMQDYSVGDLPTPTELPEPTEEPIPTGEPTPEPTDEPTPAPADAPVAVCEATETTMLPIHDATNFMGSDSYDPNGLELVDFDWQLVQVPAGSSAVLPTGDADRSGFVADQAGLYIARLVVTNSAGVESAPCDAQVEAIPGQALWIEMFWDQAGDDMDLHLLAPGGTVGTVLDCYYGNCKPTRPPLDWGTPNFADDDPTLDQDDTLFTGPENINILAPHTGNFTVVVKDFGVDTNIASTDVTVNIYIDGIQVWTDTRTITGDPTAPIEFAEIEWPSGVITNL